MVKLHYGPAGLTRKAFKSADDLNQGWGDCDVLALSPRPNDRYITGFAHSDRCLEAAQRLRYEVFNLELQEGLASSIATGLDKDAFDGIMHHLVLVEPESDRVVGTYRLQSVRDVATLDAIYSAQEYDLRPLQPLFEHAVELGRACLAVEHRNFRAMIALWLGIGAYMNSVQARHLFGCCSLTTQDPDDGWRALKAIREGNCLHDTLLLDPRPEHSCGDPARERAPDLGQSLKLPKLFRTYLRLGAKVISLPAIDREFGTIDFLVLLDGKQVALSRLDVLE